ncbi:MAG: DUF1801 domain-containing protein [Thaumarchaeota archaeon]|nr:DUF1801 domain-containing protein [Nitrososphaerota archaeon]
MAKKEGQTVEALVGGLESPNREIVERMRGIVERALPHAVESLKWGQPVYSVKGRNNIRIMLFEDHVNFGLFMGAQLRSKRLEGTGKGLRHVKVYEMDDVDEKKFTRLARGAAALA